MVELRLQCLVPAVRTLRFADHLGRRSVRSTAALRSVETIITVGIDERRVQKFALAIDDDRFLWNREVGAYGLNSTLFNQKCCICQRGFGIFNDGCVCEGVISGTGICDVIRRICLLGDEGARDTK